MNHTTYTPSRNLKLANEASALFWRVYDNAPETKRVGRVLAKLSARVDRRNRKVRL